MEGGQREGSMETWRSGVGEKAHRDHKGQMDPVNPLTYILLGYRERGKDLEWNLKDNG